MIFLCSKCFQVVFNHVFNLQYKRKNIRSSLFKIHFEQARKVGESVDIESNMLRVVGRPIYRINAAVETQFQCYLKIMCLPFFYRLIKSINCRFDKYGTLVHYMYGLMPLVLGDKEQVDIKEATN